jgi:hypothetical protein
VLPCWRPPQLAEFTRPTAELVVAGHTPAPLWRENDLQQMRRDILARAAAWFAAKSDRTSTASSSP